jgi:tRNA threonylcarbamoyladenosine biosynthesis protein TsaB
MKARFRLCHAEGMAPVDHISGGDGAVRSAGVTQPIFLLGIDTCGPAGSVALGRLCESGAGVETLGEIELAGRSYSSTLIGTVDRLLEGAGLRLADVGCLVAVNGPGSFTGVRVGLSAVKGMAETEGMRVVAVSRLEVLAEKAGVASAALDAHRAEVFLRLARPSGEPVELLSGAAELAAISPAPAEAAVCDDAAAALLQAAWPTAQLARVEPPTASDALRLGAPRVLAGDFVDPMFLDGDYLRRSDAEIFGDPAVTAPGRP